MTYYKYVKRNAESQPNWADVAKGISDTLIKTRDKREQARQDIEERSRKFGELLDNAPQGDNLEFNKLTLDMAEQSKELRRIQDNLLRSGMMSVKDYNMARQTMSDDWDNFTAFAQEANEEYAKKMKEYQDGLISRQTLDEMSYIEGFSNFTATKGHVDHMTGRLGVAKRVYDEETGTYTEDIEEASAMSINELRNRLKRSVQRVDVIAELTPSVESLGKHVEVLRRNGILTQDNVFNTDLTTDQKTILQTFIDAREDSINAILTSPDKASSVLLDYVGRTPEGKEITTQFAATQEQAEEIKGRGDDSVLVLLRDPKSGNYFADPTEKQRDIMVGALTDRFNSMIDITETPEPIDFQARKEARDAGRGQKEDTPAITSISQLWYGNENEVKQALDSLKNMPIAVGKSIERIERTERGVIVDYIDKNDNLASQTFDFYDSNDNLKTQEQFAESIGSFFGIQNVRDVLKRSEYDPNRTFGTGTGFSVVERAGEPPKAFEDQAAVIEGGPVMVTELLSEVKGEEGFLGGYSLLDNSAEAMQTAVSTALSGLPEGKKRGMIKNVREYDGNDVIQLFLPAVMQEPINIPASANVSNDLENALRMIYDAGLNRDILIPRSDFSGVITDFEKFNNAAADAEIGITRQTEATPDTTNPSGGRVR